MRKLEGSSQILQLSEFKSIGAPGVHSLHSYRLAHLSFLCLCRHAKQCITITSLAWIRQLFPLNTIAFSHEVMVNDPLGAFSPLMMSCVYVLVRLLAVRDITYSKLQRRHLKFIWLQNFVILKCSHHHGSHSDVSTRTRRVDQLQYLLSKLPSCFLSADDLLDENVIFVELQQYKIKHYMVVAYNL